MLNRRWEFSRHPNSPMPWTCRKKIPKCVARYGKSEEKFQRDGAPKMIENFCIARRLVEAGARFVALNYSRWDWHGGDGMNFSAFPRRVPAVGSRPVGPRSPICTNAVWTKRSRSWSGASLAARPRSTRTTAATTGRKRTPACWPAVACEPGKSSARPTSYGEQPIERPVKFQEVFATLYHNMGLDLNGTRIFDGSGMPRYLVDQGIEPIHELI